jgi:UDP-3-O-[3-hydroxymyristoyl] glucosamine N-acyltransferase
MKITTKILNESGIVTSENLTFTTLGLSNSVDEGSLTFLDNGKFLGDVNANKCIEGVITTDQFAMQIISSKNVIIVEDPRYSFYNLQNRLFQLTYKKRLTVIGENCSIHPRAYVSDHNVIIGNNVIIEPNVTILENVEIGNNVIIRAGSVIGSEGFEHKKTSKGILSVMHDGKVIIHDNVHIGSCNAISKGFAYRNTIIGEDSKTDNLVHIAHGVQIGKRCLFPASCMIAGSVTIGDDVWVGPNASVSSQLTIGSNAYITLGSVVTKNVNSEEKVTGNFAIPHDKFMTNFKNTIK